MVEYLTHCKAMKLVKLKSIFDVVIYIRQVPLQKKNMVALARKFRFSDEQSAKMLGMTKRTYRKMSPISRLGIPATEMVIRLSELYEIGIDTFGGSRLFLKWLGSNIIALNNRKPTLLTETGMGVEIVKNELLRMQYGILV